MLTNRTRRALAAFASTAVAATGFAAMAPAAQAAPTKLTFKCSVSILTDQVFTLDVTPELPVAAEAGSNIAAKFSGSVTVPKSTVEAAYHFLSVRSLEGSANVKAKFGTGDEGLKAALPRTTLPSTGDLTVPVAGSGTWKAGSALGVREVRIPAFSAPLIMTKADKTTQDATVECAAAAPDTVVGQVEIIEATTPPAPQASKTTAKAKYSKKSKKATITTTVKVGKKAASGKVKVKLTRGKKAVKTVTVKLSKSGKATASFKKIAKKGKYTATVSYAGSSSVKKSSKKVTFTVK